MRTAQREVETLWNRGTEVFTRILVAIGRAEVREDSEGVEEQTERLGTLISDTMILSDLHGRRRTLLEADRLPAPDPEDEGKILFRTQPIVPAVGFAEAALDLLLREPRLTRGYKEVQKAYSRSHVFALAKKASAETVEAVRRYLAQTADKDTGERKAGKAIARLGKWSEAYGRMVYRTNMTTSYTAGRFQEALDEDVAQVMGAFQYVSVRDVDTRENHEAAHGLIAPTMHSIWDTYAPPMGYNCRCSLRMISRMELKRKGLLGKSGVVKISKPATFGKAHPDNGFGGGRPDFKFYRGLR